jgi:hypothetical protein
MRPGVPVRLTEPGHGPADESELGFIDTFLDGQVLAHGVSSGLGVYPAENVSNDPLLSETERSLVEQVKRTKRARKGRAD